MLQPFKPLNPTLHADYVAALFPERERDPLPAPVRSRCSELLTRRNTAPEQELDTIDRELVRAVCWHAIRPDVLAGRAIAHHRLPPRVLSIAQATLVIAAIGEAGYPITGNGAPDYERAHWDDLDPVRGDERDRVVWAAAEYWARAASRHLTYVSLGDCRGYMPRAVQYDQPGSMNPSQRASLTFGPACDRGDECDSHGYMRRHTRRLLLVRDHVEVL